jgi:hypothetical protein
MLRIIASEQYIIYIHNQFFRPLHIFLVGVKMNLWREREREREALGWAGGSLFIYFLN